MTNPTAAILVIGDEILSGRTRDSNLHFLAGELTRIGITLREARIVADIHPEIVAAVRTLSASYTYVFTTGGIGPTHDDITADAVAKAFGVTIDEDPRAIALLLERHKPEDLNAARRRMARIPAGADLVANPVSKAPGFRIGNVVVMAGVPAVMQAMLDDVGPKLRTGGRVLVETIDSGGLPEGAYAAPLGAIAAQFPTVSIGSYPSFDKGVFRNQIVLRCKDDAALAQAAEAVRTALAALRR